MMKLEQLLDDYIEYYKEFNEIVNFKYKGLQISLSNGTFWHNGFAVGYLLRPLPKFSYMKYVTKYPKYKKYLRELDDCLENPFNAYDKLIKLKEKIYECI